MNFKTFLVISNQIKLSHTKVKKKTKKLAIAITSRIESEKSLSNFQNREIPNVTRKSNTSVVGNLVRRVTIHTEASPNQRANYNHNCGRCESCDSDWACREVEYRTVYESYKKKLNDTNYLLLNCNKVTGKCPKLIFSERSDSVRLG